jgi:2-hydroxycyclohexanecarboxyl-CoA dehydrogenase
LIDLSGRIAIVPGSSGAIGSAVGELLVECGADVALSFNSNKEKALRIVAKARQLGRRARADQVDVTDLNHVNRWVDQVLAEYGQIDILADCAGWGRKAEVELFKDQSPQKWQTILDLELMHCIYFVHAVINHMISRGFGRIISIGTDGGKVGESGLAISAAARGGVSAFFKSLAREIARYGITVNTVFFGPVDTPALEDFEKSDFGRKIISGIIRNIPMKRVAQPREIANAVVFLASDAASFITGQVLSVNGGLTMC